MTSHVCLQEEQLQKHQQLLQQLLQDQEGRLKQLLQQQENRLKEAFLTHIAPLTAAITTLMQVSNKLSEQTVCTAHAYSMLLNLSEQSYATYSLQKLALQACAVCGQNGYCFGLTHAVYTVLLRGASTIMQVTSHACESQQNKLPQAACLYLYRYTTSSVAQHSVTNVAYVEQCLYIIIVIYRCSS